TPAEGKAKMEHLVAQIGRFERFIKDDSPLVDVLPALYHAHQVRYRDYSIRQLCQEMHSLYARHDVKQLQKAMFRKASMPVVAMDPREANLEFVRGKVELIALEDARGRVAAEGALPYPPGVLCVVPGEVWDGAVLAYFLALQDAINQFPGFNPELQGVYLRTEDDGRIRAYGHVLQQ
ncbi:MAG: ornithine decarboxylase, partial [Pseudomonas sp.]